MVSWCQTITVTIAKYLSAVWDGGGELREAIRQINATKRDLMNPSDLHLTY